ncbi:HU family DNA-binding protein [Spirosoma utsteinense]|uniref:DNA-binding protein HU-beta n=1 Tax=Spirosoma utsteinense TaxID=2585773 RepID=A0ABR6WFD8_9BACT|nr:HU family DNA-binding protein [Spirosoma utsteinense]MBC3789351.1 DNA-binding protein HU-beta [Spirosoma utsteinense]MBC3795247.1 DNA-binding protein HU-beta [Spirosoma utsteinense]
MTKQDIIRRISQRTGIDPDINRSVIDAFFEVTKSAVEQGQTVYVRTFGSFGPKHRAAKVARNITQNTAMQIEAHTIPYFKPSLEFINQVRRLKVDAETND